MSPLKLSIITALLTSALTAGSFYHFHKKKVHEAAYLRYKNSEMAFQAYQRRHTETLTAPPAPTVEKPPAPSSAPAQNQEPRENYRNSGQTTPLATLQTLAWACDRGDAETVASMICFESSARTKAEAYLNSLPENARYQWKSVNEMVATQLTLEGMASPYPNADILDAAVIEHVGSDRALFRLPGTRKDRTTFQKSGDAWQVVITEAMVEAYVQQAEQAASK
jgi:hypothetical protein